MKNILYLTFYFEPDLCAGSFRNTPLAKELAQQYKGKGNVVVITTKPNRYNSFYAEAKDKEVVDNLTIYRISLPEHKSGFRDQANSFRVYFSAVKKITRRQNYDLVFASSSRLFTAYLGYIIAKNKSLPLYLDIRDIFTDTMKDVLHNPLIKAVLIPGLNYIEKKVFNYACHINLISDGFKPYFDRYQTTSYSSFPNGIDDEFLNLPHSPAHHNNRKVIVYAGNFGEGQGLHKIIPHAAKKLENDYEFILIGDGGKRNTLMSELEINAINNVQVISPISRNELKKYYLAADFLFIHLNDYEAFKKVLPSKVFELGAYDKPILAGVGGFAAQFIKENLSNVILFPPGDVTSFVRQLKNYNYQNVFRNKFIEKYSRRNINQQLAKSILSYL